MANMALGAAMHLSARPYTAADQAAVLELVNADRLPGQPEATAAVIDEVLAGRSPVDGDWWAELDVVITDVVLDGSGVVSGAVSYATRPGDGAGLILWLHAEDEDQAVAEALVGRALSELVPRTVYAFEFASALTLGLEGLPVRSRPVTRQVLEAAGFTGRDLRRYIHRPLEGPQAAPAYPVAEVSVCADPPGWQLHLRESDGTLAAAMRYPRSAIRYRAMSERSCTRGDIMSA